MIFTVSSFSIFIFNLQWQTSRVAKLYIESKVIDYELDVDGTK